MKRLAAILLLLPLAACVPHISGLLPIYPAPDGRVDSVTPTLEWEPFPERNDPHVTDVVYDLRVMEIYGTEFYSREGLAACSHKLEQPLEPGLVYLWTVRVRFRWEGRRRETQWMSLQNSPGSASSPEGLARYLPLQSPVATDGK